MSSVFSKILAGELPGRFVWQDDDVAAFLSIAPLRPGHTLVVPRREVDQWTAADPALFARCTAVAHTIGRAIQRAWDAPRVGLVVAGFEVPHLHFHVFPTWGMDDFDFGRVDQNPDPAALDEAADRIRAALAEL
jgi:diadenosine tetraphosphate (Ap4A) HIT family hydrolase